MNEQETAVLAEPATTLSAPPPAPSAAATAALLAPAAGKAAVPPARPSRAPLTLRDIVLQACVQLNWSAAKTATVMRHADWVIESVSLPPLRLSPGITIGALIAAVASMLDAAAAPERPSTLFASTASATVPAAVATAATPTAMARPTDRKR